MLMRAAENFAVLCDETRCWANTQIFWSTIKVDLVLIYSFIMITSCLIFLFLSFYHHYFSCSLFAWFTCFSVLSVWTFFILINTTIRLNHDVKWSQINGNCILFGVWAVCYTWERYGRGREETFRLDVWSHRFHFSFYIFGQKLFTWFFPQTKQK